MSMYNIFLILASVLAIYSVHTAAATKCSRNSSCCSAMFNHELCHIADEKHPCHCDVACRLHGDCCDDYREFCLAGEPVPCKYDAWQEWGPCSTSEACDVGYQTRRRKIAATGNFRSKSPCQHSAMVETKRCGRHILPTRILCQEFTTCRST